MADSMMRSPRRAGLPSCEETLRMRACGKGSHRLVLAAQNRLANASPSSWTVLRAFTPALLRKHTST
jgi:hypothetical protein